MNDTFAQESRAEIQNQADDTALHKLSAEWLTASEKNKYTYHFRWLGRPIIQIPQDIVAMQEIIFQVKPDLILETGIAHGGSLIFSASMLELNAACGWGAPEARVLGLDIDIRAHNREAIEAHPLHKRITMMEGSSIDPEMIAAVKEFARPYRNILVCLDSNHSHDHVLAELCAYAPLVAPGSYCVVFDTAIEYSPSDAFPNRPWGRGDNPMTAVDAFLKEHPEFAIDGIMDAKLLISAAPRGYLKRLG
ncbi:MAG: cephalosporin hydroxylase family protein [Candidatus Adiutrix sp.]|nr:cephalosporin hydroxylase family protein [Candidatus Adiutrix sp.]